MTPDRTLGNRRSPGTNSGGRPLEGLLVVGVEQAVAAPLATRQLADLGARVIKIENPRGGDFARQYDRTVLGELGAHFVWLNRGKESVSVNIRDPRGAAVVERLLSRADVFVQNLAPGAAARHGFDAEHLLARFPRIVGVDISGYGDGGPLSHKRAYDLLVQSEAGSCAVTGTPGAPAKPGIPLADIGAGMYAVTSVLAALYARTSSGRGAAIAVSLFDTVVEWMGYSMNVTQGTGQEPLPNGVSSPAVAPYGAYPTADGQTVVLGTTNDGEWLRLARDVLRRDDLADDPAFASNDDRVRHRTRLDDAVTAWTKATTVADAQSALDAAGLGNAKLNGVQDLLDHPHLSARDRWREVSTPAGPWRATLPPPVVDGWLQRMDPVPALGEHTDAVLAELGFAKSEVGELRSQGVV